MNNLENSELNFEFDNPPVLLQNQEQENKEISLFVALFYHESKDKECIDNVQVTLHKNKGINLSGLINHLKRLGFPLENNLLHYFSQTSEMNVFCGYDPIESSIFIGEEDLKYDGRYEIRLRCQKNNKPLIHLVMHEELQEASIQNKEKQNESSLLNINDNANIKQKSEEQTKCRRTKERKIGFIIKKVHEWRIKYQGNEQNRCSLDEAAHQVGISKKSLDDYLLQLRLGSKFGFNFNEHYNDKVGVLRAFVKKNKNQQKAKQEQQYKQDQKKQQNKK